MFALGRRFKRSNIHLNKFVSICEKIGHMYTLSDLEKCNDFSDNLYETYISEELKGAMPIKYSSLIHLQQVLLVAGYNMLVGEDETFDGEKKLEPEDIQMDIANTHFTMGWCLENLLWIVKSLAWNDLLEKIEFLSRKMFLDEEDQGELTDLQCETFRRIIVELDHLVKKSLNKSK